MNSFFFFFDGILWTHSGIYTELTIVMRYNGNLILQMTNLIRLYNRYTLRLYFFWAGQRWLISEFRGTLSPDKPVLKRNLKENPIEMHRLWDIWWFDGIGTYILWGIFDDLMKLQYTFFFGTYILWGISWLTWRHNQSCWWCVNDSSKFTNKPWRCNQQSPVSVVCWL